jgi:hypothetical protein
MLEMVHSDPWALSGMAALNADIEAPFRSFLADVIADAERHARFLNMLSMLEHIGSRKIMLTQMGGTLNTEVLKHLAEETRHAVFFKTRAEHLSAGSLEYDAESMMCRQPAVMYFGRLDAGISCVLSKAARDLPYHWVSLIVELRANWVYALYQEELVKAGAKFSLKSIIAEEKGHMADMYASIVGLDPETPVRLPRFAALETMLFKRFWAQLQTETSKLAA